MPGGEGVWQTLVSVLASVLGGMVVVLAFWQCAAWWLEIHALPGPLEVLSAFRTGMAQGLDIHAFVSLQRVLAGLFLSLLLGLLVGIPMGYSREFDRFVRPVLYFSYPVPKLALLPVVMLLLGVGESAKICVIVLILAFPLAISVRDAVKAVPEEDYALFITLRASFFQKLRHVIIPVSLPALFSGIRVSIGIAFSALFFTETFGTDKGLGFYITDCWMRLDYRHMYLGIIVLALSGVLLFAMTDFLARHFIPWKKGK